MRRMHVLLTHKAHMTARDLESWLSCPLGSADQLFQSLSKIRFDPIRSNPLYSSHYGLHKLPSSIPLRSLQYKLCTNPAKQRAWHAHAAKERKTKQPGYHPPATKERTAVVLDSAKAQTVEGEIHKNKPSHPFVPLCASLALAIGKDEKKKMQSSQDCAD